MDASGDEEIEWVKNGVPLERYFRFDEVFVFLFPSRPPLLSLPLPLFTPTPLLFCFDRIPHKVQQGKMSVFKRNTNKETNEKNGGFTNNSSPEGSQLEWTGAGELPEGAALVYSSYSLSIDVETDYLRRFPPSLLPPFLSLGPLSNAPRLYSLVSIPLSTIIHRDSSVNADGVPTYMGASGTALTWWITVAASAGFGLFGYDQGVMSGTFALH